MTNAERLDAISRLVAMREVLETVAASCRVNAGIADAADAKGLAMALLMLSESIEVYSSEATKFVKGYLNDG